jgi:opacity protein-like surface antigen
MTAFKTLSFVLCLVLIDASLASAQQTRPATGGTLERGYMSAAAGAAFSDQRSATFGLEIGERMGRSAQAYVAFTYFDDLFSDRAAADLTRVQNYITTTTGQTLNLTGRDRGLAFSGGAKYLLSNGPTFRPYVGGGPGVLNIQRTITDRMLGDVTDPVIGLYGAPDGAIDPSKNSSFKPMAEFLAGVGIAAGRTYVDVGYRYRQVLRTTETFSFSQFNVGVGMRF